MINQQRFASRISPFKSFIVVSVLTMLLFGTRFALPTQADNPTATQTTPPAASITPAPCPPPADQLADPHVILNCAVQTIQAAKAVKIKLQVSGAPAFVNTVGLGAIQFLTADGEYVAPSSVHAVVKAKLLGVAGQVEIIAIGDQQWYRNSIMTGGKFLNALFSPGFNAARLVSSDQGIQSALQSVTSLTLVGKENVYGEDVYHLTGVAPGQKVTSLTVGLITSKASVNIDIYLDTATLRAVEVILTQPETISATEPDPTRWDLELYDYDVAVTVTPPPDAITPPTVTPGTGTSALSLTALPNAAAATPDANGATATP